MEPGGVLGRDIRVTNKKGPGWDLKPDWTVQNSERTTEVGRYGKAAGGR